MKILVLGNGAREHSLCYAISKSPKTSAIYSIPGNYGISKIAQCTKIDLNDFDSIHTFCQKNQIDLIVVGPEVPLVEGIVDFFINKNIKIFGPEKFAAQLEGSKGFMKDLCEEYNIPTASYERFDDEASAITYLKTQRIPIVIKADGLAAGKGVTVAESYTAAEQAVKEIFAGRFGKGMEVVIEEFMEGEEASYFICTDGIDFLSLASAQDHKRVGEGDTGPNTGGMGAYSPAPIFTQEIKDQVDKKIIIPTLKAFQDKGHPYKGILYAGLMINNGIAKLVEYNIRFGDPECQVLMLRMKSDLVEMMLNTIDGKIKDTNLKWEDDHCATVVMASDGYPGKFEKKTVIKNLDKLSNDNNFQVFHASTLKEDSNIKADGGRVLSITAKSNTLQDALDKIYDSINLIDWPQGYFRKDIGYKAIKR